MKLDKAIKTIEDFYNIKLKKDYWGESYQVHAKDVSWIDFNGKSGIGPLILSLNLNNNYSGRGREQLTILMPDDELSDAEITFLTTSRKRNMWTDDYANTYSNWKYYEIKEFNNEEELIALLQRQKEAYQMMNGMHKDEEMKETLDRMKEIQKEIRERQNTLKSMKSKLCKVYNRKLKILME